jgi:hypothetical protein
MNDGLQRPRCLTNVSGTLQLSSPPGRGTVRATAPMHEPTVSRGRGLRSPGPRTRYMRSWHVLRLAPETASSMQLAATGAPRRSAAITVGCS